MPIRTVILSCTNIQSIVCDIICISMRYKYSYCQIWYYTVQSWTILQSSQEQSIFDLLNTKMFHRIVDFVNTQFNCDYVWPIKIIHGNRKSIPYWYTIINDRSSMILIVWNPSVVYVWAWKMKRMTKTMKISTDIILFDN